MFNVFNYKNVHKCLYAYSTFFVKINSIVFTRIHRHPLPDQN